MALQRPFFRTRYYLAVVRGGFSVLLNEGPASFWHKLVKRIKTYQGPYVLYPKWIELNEPAFEELGKLKQESLSLGYRPKISLIMTVGNPRPGWLKSTIESLNKQTYDNWELCLLHSGPDNAALLTPTLPGYSDNDKRIKVKFAANNEGTSGNLNEDSALVAGDFIGFLDQGDELAPFALQEIVKVLNTDPQADFVYSDEDHISPRGKRSAPFFKPDWSPDMLLSFMYTGRLAIYRKKLVDSLGGLKTGYDRGQEYGLVLRVIEKTKRIYHIPRILYHRGQIASGDSEARSDGKTAENAYEADKKALSDYLAGNHIAGAVCDGIQPGSFRVKREIIGNPLVSIIMPAKDNLKLSKRCIETILENTGYQHYEIVVVDNQSRQSEELLDYYREIARLPNIRIIEFNKTFNFAALNNYAVPYAKGEMILFLNNDMEVISREWLSALLEHAQRKEVGAVGAKLLYPDNSIQHCGVILGLGSIAGHAYNRFPDRPGYFGRVDIINNYSAVTAACMMVRKAVFREIGGFDENLAIDYNDIDFCLKLRQKGYLIVYTPYARLYHLESFTRGYADKPEKRMRRLQEIEYFNAQWGAVIEKGDPYYNPNLSLTRLDFSIDPKSRRNR